MLKKFIQTALLLVVLCTTATTYAQVSQAPDGIQFQALATDANGHPAAGRVIYVKDAIVAKTATGTIVYSETFKVTASSAGIFTIVLGKGTYASGVRSIANIDWANGPFFLNLKIAVEPTVPTASWNVNNEYVDLGTSQFWSVPYALYAGNVKGADTKLNITDTAAMLKPYFTAINLKANIESPTFTGTVSGITKAMVGLGNVDNTADLDKPVSTATQAALDLKANTADVTTALDLKVDKVTGKALSTNDYTTAEKTKLAAITGTNTGDQDLSALAVAADVTTALALKANAADVNAALALKANAASVANSINTINTTLNTKANTIDVNNALIAKADVVGVNNAVAALNASLVTKADYAVVSNQLGTKEDKLNKSLNVTLDAASDAKYPSVKAVKTYVDAQVADAGTLTGTTLKSTVTNSSLTSVGTLTNLTVTNPITGSVSGNAATATTAGNITATANTTLTSLPSLTSVGTIASLKTEAITNSGKVIVGASSAASASAVLEASSTTQGFLPPRMTYAQMQGIASPATGLVVFCTNCGTTESVGGELEVYSGGIWRSMIGNAATVPNPTIAATTAATSITSTTAISGGNITSDGGSPITARGVVWSTSAVPTTSDSKTTDAGTTGTFTSNLTGLTAGTLYYVRSYATNAIGTVYGTEISFTTLPPSPPTIAATTAATSITSTTGISGGNITSDGGSPITARGVCWSTSADPTTSDSKTPTAGTTGTFTSNLSGLTAGTLYYVRAYATNAIGTVYGTQISFTTLSPPTIAATTAATSITSTTAISGGNITSDGGSPITARGVVWSTTSSPTIALTTKTTDAGTTGTFTSNLTGLTGGTLYYVRAYATNAANTVYGDQISFTTLTPPPTYTIGQRALGGIIAYITGGGNTGTSGLVVTESNISTSAQWGCSGNGGISGADGSAIGTGNQNTIDIMAGCATAGIAARLCGDLVQGGYSDWYLPSKDELSKLYLNRTAIGGFETNAYYWSSTEIGSSSAYAQPFSSTSPASKSKITSFYVRAVRAF